MTKIYKKNKEIDNAFDMVRHQYWKVCGDNVSLYQGNFFNKT